MADFTWNPAGVLFDPLTLSASNIQRTGETSFTADIYIYWRGKWSNTNFGMKMTTGNKYSVGCPAYDGAYRRSYETKITGVSYYIGSASSTSATIGITLTNYKTDVNPKPEHTNTFYLNITGIPQWWTNVTPGTTSIIDHQDNTFTVSGTVGSDGTNNAVTKGTLSWTCYKPNGSWWTNTSNYYPSEDFAVSNTVRSKSKTFNLADFGGMSTADTRKVAVNILTIGEKGDSVYNTDGVTSSNPFRWFDINQYVAPSDVSDLKINYNKNRLTIKEPWTLEWEAATKRNNTSPVYGYRVRLFKKSPTDVDFKSIPIIDDNEVQLSIGNVQSDGTVYYHLDIGTDTQYTINPASCNLAAKDIFKFSIQPYTKYGTGTLLLGTEVSSSTGYAIQNAGIVRIIDANGKGQEGNVWIKISSTKWKEAETVNYKVSDITWKESQ